MSFFSPHRILLVTLINVFFSGIFQNSWAQSEHYDLVYIWDSDIENVLDYKERLEEVLDHKVLRRLRIVRRNDEYGIIFDANDVANSIVQQLAKQGKILHEAGLAEAWAEVDSGYHELYNVSYGLGPYLEPLKKTYRKIYQHLGEDVGKKLLIEKTNADNYTLVYQRRGDKRSTLKIARRHAKALSGTGIHTSITRENNNEVVYGESSLLHDREPQTSQQPSHAVKKTILPEGKGGISSSVKKAATLVSSRAPATQIEKNVEQLIKSYRKKGLIRSDERTGWMVYDLKDNSSIVDINADVLFQAASMIKPFLALAFFHQVKNGKLKYGPKSRAKMEAMIVRSSNSAANWVMRQVGGPTQCQKILRRHYATIFKNTVIKEYIPPDGKTYKNSAIPEDYIRFLKALWNKSLPYGKELRRIMALPGRDRLYHGTPIPRGTLVYNKTGSTAHLVGDMGILVPKTVGGARYPYAIVGIIERTSRPSNYSSWVLRRGNVIRAVSTLVYKELKKKHHLK